MHMYVQCCAQGAATHMGQCPEPASSPILFSFGLIVYIKNTIEKSKIISKVLLIHRTLGNCSCTITN